MRKMFALLLLIIIVSCGGNGAIEVGFNDEGLLRGTLGDITIWVSKVEFPEDNTYTTLWEGLKEVRVPVNNTDFYSVTDNYTEIVPGEYQNVRVTVDSLIYIKDASHIMLVDTMFQFVAQSLSGIVIEENDEFRVVVNIISDNWFDPESLRIRPGHDPFEGARLKIYYE